jgi:hypothetical protein
MSTVRSYEECREITRGFGTEQISTLVVLHRQVLESNSLSLEEKMTQANFVKALEDELSDRCDEIDGGCA